MVKNLLIFLLLVLCGALAALYLFGRPGSVSPLDPTNILPTRRGDLRLDISESYLERRLRTGAAQLLQANRVQDLRVDVVPGNRAILSGVTNVLGAPVPLMVDLRLAAAGGMVRAQVVSGHVGPIPLPEALLADIQTAVDQTLAEVIVFDQIGLAVVGVETDEGSVTLILEERPGR